MRRELILSVVFCVLTSVFASKIRADRTISSDYTQSGGTFTISPPTLLVTHPINNPLLTLTSGATTSNILATVVGTYSGDEGRLRIEAGSVLRSLGNETLVGHYGNANVYSGLGYLGLNLGSTGVATVSGANSIWENSDRTSVGEFGGGTLNVEAGGKVLDYHGIIGNNGVSSGTVTVTGLGSEWKNWSILWVGVSGSGTLNVLAGGRVTSSQSYISFSPGSTSTATVTGAGSEWSSSGNLYVGGTTISNGGIGTLNITDSGLVSVADLTRIWNGDTVTVNGGTLSTGSLDRTLGTLNFHDGFVKINGGTYTASGSLVVSGNTAADNPSFQLLNGATNAAGSVPYVVVGNSALRNGELIIFGGSKLNNAGSGDLGYSAGAYGFARVSGVGSEWNNASSFIAGVDGTGDLLVDDGGKLTNTSGHLGFRTGSVSAAFVEDAGSQWISSTDLYVGNDGKGSLTISNGGKVRNVTGIIANTGTSSGTVTVMGSGAEWLNSSNLFVGNTATGTLSIEDGGKVTNTSAYIGSNSVGIGTATVTGANSLWASSSDLFVGEYGKGTLNIEDGGEVTNHYGYLGLLAGSTGTATVSGTGSEWYSSIDMYVGSNGTGTLNVQSGGKVSNDSTFIANGVGSSGTATVSGADSQWNHLYDFYAGYRGNGTLNVQAGGKVTNVDAYLAYTATGQATTTVTGAGSEWSSSGNLYVGGTASANGGVATLTIADAGLVSVGGLTKTWNGDTITVNGGTLSTGSLDRSLGTFNFHDGFVKINGGTYTQAPGGLIVSGNTPTASPSFQMLDGAINAVGSVTTVAIDRKGDLVISGGSQLTNSGIVSMADGAGNTGTATVTGIGSEWNNSAEFYIGVHGTAELTVSSGGKITSGGGAIGVSPIGTGITTITDSGSQWINSALLNVGVLGSGELHIASGGKVTNTIGYVGWEYGSHGEVAVTGATSEWINTVSLFVGGSSSGGAGIGVVTIDDDGQVSAPNVTIWLTGMLNGNGGTLAGNVTNHGTIAPGNSAGVLTIDGNLTQEPAGAMQFELGGTAASSQHDQLLVTGNLSFNGVLDVSLINGFVPSVGDTFDILDWGTSSGTFTDINLPELTGLAWNTANLYTTGTLRVALLGDFDSDGDIGGRDFLAWQRGESPNAFSSSDLELWQTAYDAEPLTASIAVPEPNCLLLIASLMPSVMRRRKPRSSKQL